MADRRLQVFYTVAKHLSFTKAAEILFMTQPAVTFQVKQLEEHFSTRLFDRSHGKIALTPSGKLAMDYAGRVMDLSAEMEVRIAEMTGEVSGMLLIGASTTIADYMLPRLLGAFKTRYPQIQARLTVANSETIESKVADHTLDVGLIEASSHYPNLECKVLGQDELVMICPPLHDLASLCSVSAAKVATQPYINREMGSGTREAVDDYFRRSGVAPEGMDVVLELGSPDAIKSAVEVDLGVAIVSRATVSKELKTGDLVAVQLDPPLFRPLSVIYAPEKFRPKLLQSFLDFTAETLKSS